MKAKPPATRSNGEVNFTDDTAITVKTDEVMSIFMWCRSILMIKQTLLVEEGHMSMLEN